MLPPLPRLKVLGEYKKNRLGLKIEDNLKNKNISRNMWDHQTRKLTYKNENDSSQHYQTVCSIFLEFGCNLLYKKAIL